MVDLLAVWTSRWDPLPECKQLCFNQFFTSENVGCLEHAARGGDPLSVQINGQRPDISRLKLRSCRSRFWAVRSRKKDATSWVLSLQRLARTATQRLRCFVGEPCPCTVPTPQGLASALLSLNLRKCAVNTLQRSGLELELSSKFT